MWLLGSLCSIISICVPLFYAAVSYLKLSACRLHLPSSYDYYCNIFLTLLHCNIDIISLYLRCLKLQTLLAMIIYHYALLNQKSFMPCWGTTQLVAQNCSMASLALHTHMHFSAFANIECSQTLQVRASSKYNITFYYYILWCINQE